MADHLCGIGEGARADPGDLARGRPVRGGRFPLRRGPPQPGRQAGENLLHPAPAARAFALSRLPAADAAGRRAVRHVRLRPGDLVEPCRRQGHPDRPGPTARQLRAFADPLCLGPAAPLPGRIGPDLGAQGLAGALAAALHADLGPAHRARRGRLRRQLGLHRAAHPQGLWLRGDGGLSAGRHRALRPACAQGGVLPDRLADGAVQAHAALDRGLRAHAVAPAGGDRRRARLREGPGDRGAQRDPARLPAQRRAGQLHAARPRLRVRRRGGFRHRAGRGAGLRHAGDRLWTRRRAGDG